VYKVVALLTDFGTKDHYVGVVKGRILQVLKELNSEVFPFFVDITHQIPPQDVKRACIELYFSYRYFPENTIFLVVVDPGVGTSRKELLVKANGKIFIGPDNGVFTLILKEQKDAKVFYLKKEKLLFPPFSSTFHGRDLFAPAVAYTLAGVKESEYLIPTDVKKLRHLPLNLPKTATSGLTLEVWHVDSFGNLITNFKKPKDGRKFKVLVNGKEVPLVNTYGEAKEGELIALFGSEGLLEIAIRNGSAWKYFKEKYPEVVIKWR